MMRPQRCLSMELDDGLNAEISGSEIGLQDGVPIRAFHAHDQLVAGYARIIYQNVDFAELRNRRLNRRLHLFFVGDVERECGRVSARVGYFADEFVQLFLIACRHGYRRAFSRQPHRAGAANALRCPGDQSHPS